MPALQHINGLCAYPHSVCFTSASLDGQALPAEALQDPLPLRLPNSGIFKVWCGTAVTALKLGFHTRGIIPLGWEHQSVFCIWECPSSTTSMHLQSLRHCITGQAKELLCSLQVCFVDLRPVPVTAKAVSPEGFAVLLQMLSGADKLDGWELADVIDAADLETKVIWWI